MLWFLLFVVTMAVLFAAGVGLMSWRMARHNRVDPDVETLAPILWLWAPSQPARLHRRLRAAAAPVHIPAKPSKHAPPLPPNADLCRRLAGEAVQVDNYIVMASRMSRVQRKPALRSLNSQVIEVEQLSRRLVQDRRRAQTPAGMTVPTAPRVLAEIRQQLDLLDEAQRELLEIEQSNGLLDPDEFMARTRTAVPESVPQSVPPSVPKSVPEPPPHEAAAG